MTQNETKINKKLNMMLLKGEKEIAKYFGCATRTIERWNKQGKFDGARIVLGRRLCIETDKLKTI